MKIIFTLLEPPDNEVGPQIETRYGIYSQLAMARPPQDLSFTVLIPD
jgi:hypothetical protein